MCVFFSFENITNVPDLGLLLTEAIGSEAEGRDTVYTHSPFCRSSPSTHWASCDAYVI